MTTTINMAAYARMLSGLDPMVPQGEMLVEPQPGGNYPPANIDKIGDNCSRVTLAVAGFSDNELSIAVEANQLTVTGKKEQTEKAIPYREFAHRPFSRRFSLAEHVVVKAARLAHGILAIELERETPEAAKSHRIVINGSAPSVQDNNRAAA